jgi:surfeit locus 1 family protein
VFLDNRLRDGVPGYEVLTPLRLSGSDRVLLVNRGWIAAPRQRDRLPQVETPAGEVRVQGLAFMPSDRFIELRADTDDASRWQNWTLARAQERWAVDLLPVAMLQSVPSEGEGAGTGRADGLARDWPRPDAGIDKHRGYALQWFSFAGIGFIVWLLLSFRRNVQAMIHAAAIGAHDEHVPRPAAQAAADHPGAGLRDTCIRSLPALVLLATQRVQQLRRTGGCPWCCRPSCSSRSVLPRPRPARWPPRCDCHRRGAGVRRCTAAGTSPALPTVPTLRGKWFLVMADGAECDARCERKIWQLRQLRTMQGKEMERVERVWLVDDRGEPSARLHEPYAGTWVVRQPDPALLGALSLPGGANCATTSGWSTRSET